MKNVLDNFDNDTLVIVALSVMAILYVFNGNGEQVVTSISSGFIGYLRGLSKK